MGKRYDTIMRMINRGIKVDEKSGQKIVGWSPNNVRRLIICPDGALVQFHCCPSGSKYTKLIDVQQFQPQWIEQDIQEYQQGKYKSLLKVLVEGRICSCIEEIVISDKIPAPLKQADSNLVILANSKGGSSALVTRFPRLRGIWKCNADMNDIYKATKGNFDELKGDKISRDGLGDKLRQLGVQIAPLYEGKKDWWKGSYLRANIYNFDTEGAPLHKRFMEIRDYFEQAEKNAKLFKSYEEKFKALAMDENVKGTLEGFVHYYNNADKFSTVKVPILAEAQGLKYLRDTGLAQSIRYHCESYFNSDRELKQFIRIGLVVDMLKKYSEGSLSAVLDDVLNGMVRIGLISKERAMEGPQAGGMSPTDMLKNTDEFIHLVHDLTAGIIGAAYAALGSYLLSGGTPELNARNVKRFKKQLMTNTPGFVGKGVYDTDGDLCYLTNSNLSYCNKVLGKKYTDYFAMLKIQSLIITSKTEEYAKYNLYANKFFGVFDGIIDTIRG